MSSPRPASRIEAAKAKERFYFTGKPCVHGHIADRYTGSGRCVECDRARSKDQYEHIKSLRMAAE